MTRLKLGKSLQNKGKSITLCQHSSKSKEMQVCYHPSATKADTGQQERKRSCTLGATIQETSSDAQTSDCKSLALQLLAAKNPSPQPAGSVSPSHCSAAEHKITALARNPITPGISLCHEIPLPSRWKAILLQMVNIPQVGQGKKNKQLGQRGARGRHTADYIPKNVAMARSTVLRRVSPGCHST